MISLHKLSVKQYWLITISIIIVTACILFAMGRIPICKCGYVKFWHGETVSSENSQHMFDFYTFSHIIHGFGFYWILTRIARRSSIGARMVLAVIPEALWELLENTDMIINRYRAATISLDYFGDSVLNSSMDIAACIVGFWLAAKLPIKVSLVLVILMELIVGYLIRDNLTLNVIMLLYPLEQIRTWQAG